MDLPELNDALFAEFFRITGCTSRYEFPAWWAEVIYAIRRDIGARVFSAMTREDQRRLVLARLRLRPSRADIEARAAAQRSILSLIEKAKPGRASATSL